MRWAGWICVLLCAGVLSAGCGAEDQPGSPDVYAEIAAMDTCGDLQRWFDQVMDNAEALEPGEDARDISLAYADATIERMDDLDCG